MPDVTTILAGVFTALGAAVLLTLFLPRKKGSKRPSRASRGFRLVFSLVLLASGLLKIVPQAAASPAAHYAWELLHLPASAGLEKAGVQLGALAPFTIPLVTAVAYALLAFVVLGLRRQPSPRASRA